MTVILNRSFIKRQTRDSTSDNEWKRVAQQVTMSNKKWQWGVQRMTTNKSKWLFQLNFFFRVREKSITRHPEKYPFDQKSCEVPWKGQIQLKDLAKQAFKKKC